MSKSTVPYFHAAIISFITLFYASIFIFTSNHMEFNNMLANGTLQPPFWNGWSSFIEAGNMKYIGYIMIVLTAIILVTMVIKKQKRYDEYQLSILNKLLVIVGIVSLIMLPIVLFILLSDPNYLIETLFLFALIQSFSVLLGNLVYTFKTNGRSDL